MATFTTVLCFLVLAHPCMGASLTATKTMRSESSVEVNARAQLATAAPTAAPFNSTTHIAATNYTHMKFGNFAHYCPKAQGNFCGCDYDEGQYQTKFLCQNQHEKDGTEEVLMDPAMCEHAASHLQDVHTESDHFLVTNPDYLKFPMGCFKTNCINDPSKICYRFNTVGDDSMLDSAVADGTFSGTPICFRDRYLNGTYHTGATSTLSDRDSTAGGTGVCPTGYKVIMSPDQCSKASGCLPYCTGGNYEDKFLVGSKNSSRHLDYPIGCFVNTKPDINNEPELMRHGCVYFNAPTHDAPGGGMGQPINPHGTVLCIVENDAGRSD